MRSSFGRCCWQLYRAGWNLCWDQAYGSDQCHGVVLHTNLGRAPLPAAACKAMAETAGYVNLELDLADGERSSRLNHVRELLCLLTGAEAALVVNNNAAAVLLVLSVLAAGKEVIVSRGQLVEIGGSFRLPDIMRAGGAQLVEVGTTNHTRPSDYEMAIGADTALLLRVHPSNFTITGYTGEVDLATLVGIGRRHGIPVMEDLGSGLMVDFPGADLTLPAAIAAGAAIVTASGDKMLGGPQAGLLLGRAELIEPLAKSPLFRAMRLEIKRAWRPLRLPCACIWSPKLPGGKFPPCPCWPVRRRSWRNRRGPWQGD